MTAGSLEMLRPTIRKPAGKPQCDPMSREAMRKAGASLKPEQRAVLTKRLELARTTASALAKYSQRRETPPSARAIIPGSLDALLAAVI